ncbi:hypothetical protein V8C86DRAFT_2845367 [Haematococcus lacustris]
MCMKRSSVSRDAMQCQSTHPHKLRSMSDTGRKEQESSAPSLPALRGVISVTRRKVAAYPASPTHRALRGVVLRKTVGRTPQRGQPSAADAPASGPLYMDEGGTTHSSVQGATDTAAMVPSPPHSPPTIQTIAAAHPSPGITSANSQLVPAGHRAFELTHAGQQGEDAVAARLAKAASQSVKPAKWAVTRGARVRRDMPIYQPRQNNS